MLKILKTKFVKKSIGLTFAHVFLYIWFTNSILLAAIPPSCDDLDAGKNWSCVGQYIYENGDIYDGKFKTYADYKNGIPNGPGSLTTKDGTSFVGLFKNGKLNGFGQQISSQGKIVKEGIFKNDKFIGKARKLLYQAEPDPFQQKVVSQLFDTQINDKDCKASGALCAGFRPISVDLNLDGFNEIIVMHASPYWCGSGGCYSYILSKDQKDGNWKILDLVFGADWDGVLISPGMTDNYYDIYLGDYECVGGYKCSN